MIYLVQNYYKIMSEDGNMSPLGYQSPIRASNPPPPPELQDNEAAMADIIKGTLISKNWVISILLKLLKEVEMEATEDAKSTKASEERGKEDRGADQQLDEVAELEKAATLDRPEQQTQHVGAGDWGAAEEEQGQNGHQPVLAVAEQVEAGEGHDGEAKKRDDRQVEGDGMLEEAAEIRTEVGEEDEEVLVQGADSVDVDEELQDELCQLWDVTNNANVACFLNESKAVSILAKVISVTRAPRLSEISVGILGNMCCVPDLCKEMSENETFMSLIMALLSNTEFDALTLKETMRLVYTCLSNSAVNRLWVSAIGSNPYCRQLLIYIFSNSLNSELLKSTADAVDTLLDMSDDLCQEWADSDFVEALLEAVQQIGFERSEDLAPFLHMFQLMTTSQQGAQALVENGEGVVSPLLSFLSSVCDYEIVAIEDHLSCLCSVVSVVHLLFTSDPAVSDSLVSKPRFFEHMLKVLEGLFRTNRHVVHAGLPFCEYATRRHSMERHHHHHRHSHRERRTSEKQLEEEAEEGERSQEEERDKVEGDSELPLSGVASSADDASKVESKQSNESHKSEGKEEKKEGRVEENGDDYHLVSSYNRVGMRMLFTLLQDFFREYVNSLKLDDSNKLAPSVIAEEDEDMVEDDEKKTDSDADSNPPLFLPVLRCLNTASHKPIAYLITTLVYGLSPDPGRGKDELQAGEEKEETLEKTRDGSFPSKPDTPSEAGLGTAEHLLHLCKKLGFSRAARIVKDCLRCAE